MKNYLRHVLFAEFDNLMGSSLPQFRGRTVSAGGEDARDYVWQMAADLYLMIRVYPSSKRDDFTLELAWSQDSRWPDDVDPATPRDWPEIKVREHGTDGPIGYFRLPKLWVPPKKDPWWEVVPRSTMQDMLRQSQNPTDLTYLQEPSPAEARAKVIALAKDAHQKLIAYGVPFFRTLAERRGFAF